MKEFRTITPPVRSPYVPASLKVIEITSQGIICTSGGSYNDPFGGGSESI